MDSHTEKYKIIEKSLEYIAQEGWKENAFEKACEDIVGSAGCFYFYFPGGIDQTIKESHQYFMQGLENKIQEDSAFGSLGITAKIRFCCYMLLESMNPHHAAFQHLKAYFCFPPKPLDALGLPYKTADYIWHTIGDQSIDFSYYSKRASLAFVWGATVNYWLEALYVEDLTFVYQYFEKRLQTVQKIPDLKRKATMMAALFEEYIPLFKKPKADN